MSLSREVELRVQAFVGDIGEIVRRAALEAVSESLGDGPSPRGRAPRARRASPARNGGKRDPKKIATLTAAVAAHVKAHPGEGVETIAKHLRVATKEITLPIAKLLAAKKITKKGEKRATKYFAR
jgi:hypothetical protein